MNEKELCKWLAGHRPAPQRVCAVLAGGHEHQIAIRNGAHRWMHAAKLLTELRAESIRLYDEDGRIIGSTELLDVPAAAPADVADVAPASTVDGAVLRRASDVGIITHAVADAIVRAVRESTKAQADVHKVAFEQLAKVAELATERVQSLEGLVQSLIEARAAELAKREAEAEAGDDGGTSELMKPLLQGAGAELVQHLPKLLQLAQSMSAPTPTNGAAANGASHGPPK